ncbi:MAG: DUF5719 family protein [Actinomycetota bacterium]
MRWTRAIPAIILIAALMLTMAPLAQAQQVAQVPVIDSIFPSASWVGMPVAISGSEFGLLQLPLISTVTFNGVDAGQAIIWTDTYIVVIVPEGATSGPVVVTTLLGSSEPYDFTVYEQPAAIPCYFAEGTTRAGFEEWLTLYNPYDVQYTATVTYLVADGANRIRYYNIPAHSRMNIYVNSEIGSDRDVSMVVTGTERLYAERPMYFRYNNAWTGGHCGEPALAASNTWYFAEGTTRPGFDEWLCLANPGAQDATAQVTYIFPDGEAETIPYTVPAWKRYTVNVNDTVGAGRDVAVRVDSDQPIVAERPMYFAYRGEWDDGHITPGAPAPLTTWYFAEGTTQAGFDEYLCLANPGEEDATVEVTYYLVGGQEIEQQVTIAAERRQTILVNSVVGPGKDVAVRVDSDQPIVAERPMYFQYATGWDGGHLSLGTPDPSVYWFFAEGTTRSGFAEWLCLFNPGEVETRVNIKYVFGDASSQTQDVLMAPGQRFSISVNEMVGPDKDVAIWVESEQGIVAERSMYFSYMGVWDGGHNARGTLP